MSYYLFIITVSNRIVSLPYLTPSFLMPHIYSMISQTRPHFSVATTINPELPYFFCLAFKLFYWQFTLVFFPIQSPLCSQSLLEVQISVNLCFLPLFISERKGEVENVSRNNNPGRNYKRIISKRDSRIWFLCSVKHMEINDTIKIIL